MLTSVCFVPATPLLVPEIGGTAAAETAGLRAQVVGAAEGMGERADRWFVIGAADVAGPRDGSIARYPRCPEVGTFAGFGPDVRVSLSGERAGTPDAAMPLPLLIAGWLRGAVRPDARPAERIGGLGAGCGASPADCADAGARLRAEVDSGSQRTGVLVVADGPTTLTDKAPGAFDARAQPVADAIGRAVADGDCAALAGLDPGQCAELGVTGRAAWQVAAGLVGDRAVTVSRSSMHAPYGVGYYTGLWLL